MKNKRKIGGYYEQMAAEFLTEKGFLVLEFNYRNRFGEIDLIAKDLRQRGRPPIVFVEVKYRANEAYGFPVEAVNTRKQRTIVRVAWYYLLEHGLGYDCPSRFDIITINGSDIELLENAFYGYYL